MIRRLLFANFRNVYRLSRWSRQRLTPLGATFAGALVATGVFAIDTRQTLAFQVAALLCALLLLAAAASLWFRPRLAIRRRLPRFATAGVPLAYGLHVRNHGSRVERDLQLLDHLEAPLPAFGEFLAAARRDTHNWFDRFVGYPRWLEMAQRRRGANIDIVTMPTLPSAEEIELRVPMMPTRRGYVRFEAVSVLRPDPLGLVNAIRRYPMAESLLVLPARYPAPRVRFSGRRRYQPGGEGLASSVGDSQEFASLRDYRPGDPMRHIHWRSWARTGKPVVKEFQDEFFDRNALVLDTCAGCDDPAVFEEAVSVAASFACADYGPDALLELLLVGPGAVQLTAGRGLADTADLLEVLACVEARSDQPFERLADRVVAQLPRLSSVVCVLCAWDEPRRRLIRRLAAHALQGIAVVVYRGPVNPLEGDTLAAEGLRLVPLELGRALDALRALDTPARLGAAA
jgi:uncharacterized protein (DUF58 family)